MSCSMCCSGLLGSGKKPSGQFVCKSGHIICNACIRKNNGACMLCGDKDLRFVSTNVTLSRNEEIVSNSVPQISTFDYKSEGNICPNNSLKTTTLEKDTVLKQNSIEKNLVTSSHNQTLPSTTLEKGTVLKQNSIKKSSVNSSHNQTQPTVVKVECNSEKKNIGHILPTHSAQLPEESKTSSCEMVRHLTYLLDSIPNNSRNVMGQQTVLNSDAARSQNFTLHELYTNDAKNVEAYESSTAPTAPPMEPYYVNPLDGQIKLMLPLINQILLMQLMHTLNATMIVPQSAPGFVPLDQNQAVNYACQQNEIVTEQMNLNPQNMGLSDAARIMYAESYNILLRRNQSLALQNAILKNKLEEKNKKELIKKYKNDNTKKAHKAKNITTSCTIKSKQLESEKCLRLPSQNVENKETCKKCCQKCEYGFRRTDNDADDNLKLLFKRNTLNDESDVSSKNIPFYTECTQCGSRQTYFGNTTNNLENEDKNCRKRAGNCNYYRTACTNIKYSEEVCTISVSTESYSSLAEESKVLLSENSIVFVRGVTQRQECILRDSNKAAGQLMDERMQKVLKTINEDNIEDDSTTQSYANEINLSKKPIYQTSKKTLENLKQIETFLYKENKKKLHEKYEDLLDELGKADAIFKIDNSIDQTSCNQDDIAELISMALRARYNPVRGAIMTIKGNKLLGNTLIPPQFEIIKYPSKSPSLLARLVKERFMPKNLSSYTLRLPRHPIVCPQCKYRQKCFISDFIIHLLKAHSELPMERISPRMMKNFFIDIRVAMSDKPRCQMVYLVRDKITALGHSEYNDLLPVLIMTSRLPLSEIMHTEDLDPRNELYFLVVWAYGLIPGKYPINILLSAWNNTGRYPKCQVVYSGPGNSLREQPTPLEIFESGQCLYLSPKQQLELVNKKYMISMQCSIY